MGFKILHHPFQGMEKVNLLDLLKRICTLIRLQVAAVAEFFGNQRTDTGQSCIDRL